MLAAGKLRMSAGARTSTSYTLTVGTKSVPPIPTYDDGFYNSASLGYANSSAVAIGSLSAATFKAKTVNGIYWTSGSGHGDSYGQIAVEIATNVGAGFVTGLTVEGVSMGTIVSSTYDAGTGSYVFYFTPLRSNPFGTSGTKTVVLS